MTEQERVEKRQEFVAALREFASFIEQRTDLPVPHSGPCFSGFLDQLTDDRQKQGESLVKITREFTAKQRLNGGGSLKKENSSFHMGVRIIDTPMLTYIVFADKEVTCERVTKKRVVPEKIIPAQPAVAEQIIPAHEESYEDWDCHPILKSVFDPVAESEQTDPECPF